MVRAPDQSRRRSGRLCNAARRAARIAGVWLVRRCERWLRLSGAALWFMFSLYIRDAPYRLPMRIYGGSGLKTSFWTALASVLQDASSGFAHAGFALPAAAKV